MSFITSGFPLSYYPGWFSFACFPMGMVDRSHRFVSANIQYNGQTVQTYSKPFTVSAEGVIKSKFRSIDKAGNEEVPQEIEIKIDKTPPQVSIDANPKILWPPNDKMIDVKITGLSFDLNLLNTKITVEDEYHVVESIVTDFNQTIKLQASRNGNDKDGRKYTVRAVAEDLAGNISQAQTEVIVPHDQRK